MKATRFFICLLSLLFLASCAGARFERDWNTAIADHESGKTNAVTGPWTGTWTTATNGHTGDLRCIVESNDGKTNGPHKFRYHATWGKIFKGGYNAEYDVKKSGSSYAVTGSKDLGMFGTFDHDGKIRGNQFDATYESTKGDKGAFEMKRPE